MSLSHACPDSDVPGQAPAANSDRAPSRLPKLVLALGITFFAVAVIAIVLAGVRIYQRDYKAIPPEEMHVELRDESGISSIVTPAFVLSFEGYSDPSTIQSGSYFVDGRYAYTPWRTDRNVEITYDDEWDAKISYSPRRRMAGFDFKGQHAEYIKHQQKLTVNGHEYSTANGQVRLLIKPTGDVQRLDDPPK